MKVVIVNQHPHDFIGGSEIQSDTIATHLTAFGHQVVYLAVHGTRERYETPYQVISLKGLGPFLFYRTLKALQPDVVYWRFHKNGLLASASIAHALGSKFVYSMCTINDSKVWVKGGQVLLSKRWSRNRRIDWRAMIRDCVCMNPLRNALNYMAIPLFVDGIVSNNSDYLAAIKTGKKITIHNSAYSGCESFSWHKPYVVWVANLKTRKHPEEFLRLAQTLQGIGCDFLMVGAIHDDFYRYYERGEAKVAGFEYLGPKSPEQVNGIIKGCLFLVHTCEPEGFPGNLIQAWMQAKPTVSLYFDPEGCIEMERLGFFSRTFPRFVEHTRTLVRDSKMRTEMGHNAKRFAEREFVENSNVRALEAFLTDIVNGPAGGIT